MEYKGCKDEVFDVIDEASDKFGESYFLNEQRYGELDEICGLLDRVVQMLIEEFGCGAVTIEVDQTTKELIFDIVCDEIILEGEQAKDFFALVEKADSIRFSKAKPDRLRIEIGVSNLWLGGCVYE